MAEPLIAAVETSCDETAVALLRGRSELLGSEVASQTDLHRPHGGVVPEVASRDHLLKLPDLFSRTLDKAGVTCADLDAIAATSGPGLASSLMVGLAFAKGIAAALDKPFIAVNHLEGHLLSPFFGEEIPPFLGLIVSGGHTLLVCVERAGRYAVVGRTLDDAAGEAFDKVAKLLGLPYPGGPQIEIHARDGNPLRFDFPKSMLRSGDHDFSFSGLKTSVRYLLPSLAPGDLADVCASFQETVAEILATKAVRAAVSCGLKKVALSGGVSCNLRVREVCARRCEAAGLSLRIARPDLCTDNAAMIARVALERHLAGEYSPLEIEIDPNLPLQHSAEAACP